jgi:molybdopterin synthase sulfur carrier subunit
MVTVLLWAAARDAAGTPRVTAEPGPLSEVLASLVTLHPGLRALVPRSRIVVDGELHTDFEIVVADGSTVEVLPPFAGG